MSVSEARRRRRELNQIHHLDFETPTNHVARDLNGPIRGIFYASVLTLVCWVVVLVPLALIVWVSLFGGVS